MTHPRDWLWPQIPSFELGPEPGSETPPHWSELLDTDDGYGRLRGADFKQWATADMDAALAMLEGYIADLPEDHKPRSFEERLACVAWADEEDRDLFVTQLAVYQRSQENQA